MDSDRRRLLQCCTVTLTAGLAGCNAIPNGGGGSGNSVPLAEIDVRLVDVRPPSAGFTSATIPILVGFTNPTSTPIPDLSGDLDIFLHDTRIGSEDLALSRLDPSEETIEELSVTVEYSNISESIVESITSGSFPIRIEGELRSGGATESFSVSSE